MIDDCASPFLWFTLLLIACIGGCDRVRISMLEDSERNFRKRINDLELRIYHIEQKGKVAK